MGQTLTHGVYLPDEGERNCYDGLAGNWQLLDGAVGTIAEHTAALAGKAPLVHTHTVSQITDFPAYGNAAGTICEGNDSRLSDARTPVAHTHVTADVTDLLNSAHTWSGEQTFSQTIHGNADTATEFASNQSVTLTGTIEGTASSKAGWTIATNFREGRGARTATDFYVKLASGLVSGSWNVYVATFMCNASERFETALVQICFVVNQQGIVDTTNGVQLRIRSIHGLPTTRFILVYKNDTNRVLFELYAYNPSANQGILAQLLNEFIRSNNKQSVSIQTYSGIIVNALPDGYTVINAETALTANDFIPVSNSTYNLGTSTNKWKTLNGVNPGALSFPSDGTTENTDWFNVAGSILPIGGNATDLTGGHNFFTPPKDGWLCLVVKNCSYISVWDGSSRIGQSLYGPDTTKNQQIILPVLANHSLEIRVIGSSWYSARLIMPKGNV